MKKLSWKGWAGLAAAVLVLGGAGAWWWMQGRTPELSYRTGKLERGSLQATVSASGAVTPVTQVSVGTQVSGQIKELYADFNSEVKAGQLIALIDPETFEYRVRQSQADVDAAQAAVLTAQATAAASRAAVSRVKVDLAEAQRDLERKRQLVEKQFIAQSELDKAQALVNTSAEAVKSAEAQLGVSDAQIKSAQANVAQRQAALAQARIDLTRTRITSPVNGIVIKRSVDRGQTVAASLQAPELFVIAKNLQDMEVDASIDESDVGRIRPGQHATFTVDAFPGQTFEGDISQVRKAAQNVANVVTYIAVVNFNNASGRLLPGMTANVRVITDQRENVLKVPNAALRVRLAGVEPAGAQPAASGATRTGQAGGWSWLPEAQAQPAGGGLAAMRERLVAELQLTADQQARFDAITAELRPQFAALRDLPDDQRGPARDKVLGEMRGRINAMLNAEQRARYAQLQAQSPLGGGRPAGGGAGGAAGPVPGAAPSGAPAGRREAAAAGTGPASPAAQARAASASTASAPPSAPASGPAAAGAAPGAAPGGGTGNPAADFRNRLVAELALTPEQIQKVDAIYADVRPRFMQLRDLPAEERPKARDRISADVRARIGDILTPGQKPRYAAILAELGSRTATRGRIYLMGADGKPRAFNVRLGITDGTSTELVVAPGSPEAADLKEGAEVIVGVSGGAQAKGASTGPRMPF